MLFWDDIGLGLQQTPGSSIHAKLRAESFEIIPTQSRQTTSRTISECTIQYGTKKQYPTLELKAPLLDKKAQWFIQQVCGKFLFLGRAVDSTLLCPIIAIALQSSKPTDNTVRQILQLLDYMATQEEALLSYHASNMVLAVHNNARYLSKPKA
jgi:hypothetical protein